MNFSEMPSLSECLDLYIKDVEVVPGKVENVGHRLNYTFSIPSDEVAMMTADELFNLYLKPILRNYFAEGLKKLGRVCTKALPLPGKGEAVIGFRCWQGKIPVNLYVCRRPEVKDVTTGEALKPDRHQYILDALVYPIGDNDEVE